MTDHAKSRSPCGGKLRLTGALEDVVDGDALIGSINVAREKERRGEVMILYDVEGVIVR